MGAGVRRGIHTRRAHSLLSVPLWGGMKMTQERLRVRNNRDKMWRRLAVHCSAAWTMGQSIRSLRALDVSDKEAEAGD